MTLEVFLAQVSSIVAWQIRLIWASSPIMSCYGPVRESSPAMVRVMQMATVDQQIKGRRQTSMTRASVVVRATTMYIGQRHSCMQDRLVRVGPDPRVPRLVPDQDSWLGRGVQISRSYRCPRYSSTNHHDECNNKNNTVCRCISGCFVRYISNPSKNGKAEGGAWHAHHDRQACNVELKGNPPSQTPYGLYRQQRLHHPLPDACPLG